MPVLYSSGGGAPPRHGNRRICAGHGGGGASSHGDCTDVLDDADGDWRLKSNVSAAAEAGSRMESGMHTPSRRFWAWTGSGRGLAAGAALVALSGAVGCNEDQALRTFRGAASDAIASGLKSILTAALVGLRPGAFV